MYDLVVVGAGPYGLSIASHAEAAGLRLRVLGRPMASWRDHMPHGMFLKSEPWASNLSDPDGLFSLDAYCRRHGLTARHGEPLPIGTFTDYGMWFAGHAVPDVEELTVTSVRPFGSGFLVATAEGESIETRTVALAVGVMPFVHYPGQLRGLPPELVSHSSSHRDLAPFAGRDVTVVGAGQAALETAALLAEHGAAVRLVARAGRLNWNTVPAPLERGLWQSVRRPHSGLGSGWTSWAWSELPWAFRRLPAATRGRIAAGALGPAGAWWLRERFEPRVPVLPAHRLRGAAAGGSGLRLDLTGPDGDVSLWTDHVVAATGFSPSLDRLPLLDREARAALATSGTEGRTPELSAGFESSLPGLFFAGLLTAPSFGPAMRFVHGATFTADRLVRGVLRRLRSHRTSHRTAYTVPRPAGREEPVPVPLPTADAGRGA
ncbi:NAD(P)-binding domain-containing protein [Streptomyces sp. GC420]|uniref:NAD(P)-binding domain-containing protein n=1 Tax=Streptomyces sp. GC420 TaxID=2697568 RepID=UPI001414E713|nr:NAD(P)-binding domain-containing protein [Streptomyces sp. GC420]NBM19654.1 NAD(P)-binding domain-containing protein [Streptomyces sp. GC420]